MKDREVGWIFTPMVCGLEQVHGTEQFELALEIRLHSLGPDHVDTVPCYTVSVTRFPVQDLAGLQID